GKVAWDGIAAVESEQDVEFARESAPALIKTLEVLRSGNKRDFRSLVLISQSYGQFAFGFLEEDMLRLPVEDAKYKAARERAALFYGRGRDFGIAALVTRGMGKAFKSPFPEFKAALRRLGKKDVPALFWTSFSWAGHLNLNLDDPASIADLPRIEAMIDRAIELDPGFYFGSALAMKGVIASARPAMLGGRPNEARASFEKAMRAAPGYLMTKVLFAQYFARQQMDEELFGSLLREVLAADAAALPEQRLANELAKRRASLLLGMQKKLF
ncbi:MAG TPA: TRAP transporter TatT component family protein, partial [bacterium]|nr:TRAP transporter TatT component family protein [bacterium]